jgi:phosphate/sulfate permease
VFGAAAPVAVSDFSELSFALSIAGVGAIVGQGFAAYRHGRDPRANTTRIVFCWTLSGFVLGWLLVLVRTLQ